MPEFQNIALGLARTSQRAAALLYDAICNGCRTCAAEISDLNRQASLDLSDAERRCLSLPEESHRLMPGIIGLGECVARAFSAALLLSDPPDPLPPLCDIVSCNLQLAEYPERLLSHGTGVSPYSLHLAANKGRGAHALLLTNYCGSDSGRRLLPLILALESHRNTLEHTCSLLTVNARS